MNVKVHKALRNETRFHLLRELKEEPLTYTDLMKKLGMDVGRDRGKFTYHLNILKDSGLIKQEGDTYRITEQGEAALVSAKETAEVAVHRSLKPPLGGLLLMLSGLLDMLVLLEVVHGSTISTTNTNFPLYVFITILLLLRILTIVSGFVAINRRFWIVAILGGIVGVINVALTLGTILALVGTVLIAISRKEFK